MPTNESRKHSTHKTHEIAVEWTCEYLGLTRKQCSPYYHAVGAKGKYQIRARLLRPKVMYEGVFVEKRTMGRFDYLIVVELDEDGKPETACQLTPDHVRHLGTLHKRSGTHYLRLDIVPLLQHEQELSKRGAQLLLSKGAPAHNWPLTDSKPPQAPHEVKERQHASAKKVPTVIETELRRRKNMWAAIVDAGGPNGVRPQLLRDIGVYRGAQGIYVDKDRTSMLTEDGRGVTVSLLHTGGRYADDLYADGLLYHYPDTARSPGRDQSEVNATKAAAELGLPVFVVTYPTPSATLRNVHLGWIEDWDDETGLFLVTFSPAQPQRVSREQRDSQPFELTVELGGQTREVTARRGQQQFRFHVFQRYGPRCSVCGMDIPQLLDAVHIVQWAEGGTDDPRNGLVLCALHHRALDRGLFAIDPNTLGIRYRASGPDECALGITRATLHHLVLRPHREALDWAWERWA